MPPSLFEELTSLTGLDFVQGQHLALVVSQDCDVVHPRYSAEPTVEIIRATCRSNLDGNLVFAKSSRKLQLELVVPDGAQVYELPIHERCAIDRRILGSTEPDALIALSEGQKRQLAGWLAKRYRRDPFPDEFVERLREKPHAEALRDLLKEWGKWLSGVYVLLDTEEDLQDSQRYCITVWATVPVSYFEDEAILSDLNEDFQPLIEQTLDSFSGIEVVDVMVVSEADFSLDDVRHTRKMDLDDLSYRDDGPTTENE